MRPQGRGDLESLYFRYPHFDPPVRAIEARSGEIDGVAIVGAGPVGLVAALTLAHHGVRSTVIERNSTFNDGSRAICIARASFHILDQIGAAQPFLAKALGWTTGRTFYRGSQILEFEMPHSPHERFLPMYNLQQQYIEQFLYEAAARCPLIDVRWQSEVMSVVQDDRRVALAVQDPHGCYQIEAPWLLAADGARSATRTFLGHRLKGANYEGRYVIADVRLDLDYPTIRRALFDPACLPGGTVLIHRQPDDIWRIDYQLADGETAEEATREEAVRQRVGRVLAEIDYGGDWELEWWSVYSANTLALDDYRDRRVFFIGDSAHIVPIFGVRGLNNGIADAHNIGWKLAKVMTGDAGAGLLDSYSPERRGATLDVFANATKSTRFMTPPTRGWTLMRDAALSLALSQDFARPFANPRQMAPYSYAGSPLAIADAGADGFNGGSTVGAYAPNALLGDDCYLLDAIGRGFTLLMFGRTSDGAASALEDAGRTIDVHFLVSRVDPVTAAYAGTHATACYLIRPDFYIAARWISVEPDQLQSTLRALLDRA